MTLTEDIAIAAAAIIGERSSPKVGYTQLYGAPGTAGVSILSV